jgi:hypothetical protein
MCSQLLDCYFRPSLSFYTCCKTLLDFVNFYFVIVVFRLTHTGSTMFDQYKATASNTKPTPQPTSGLFRTATAAPSTSGFGVAPAPAQMARLFGSWTASSSTIGGFGSTTHTAPAPTAVAFGSTQRSDGVSGSGTQKATLSSFCAAPESSKTAVQTGGLFSNASQPDAFGALRNTFANTHLPDDQRRKGNTSLSNCEECSAVFVSDAGSGTLCDACEAKKKTSCWLCWTNVKGADAKIETT